MQCIHVIVLLNMFCIYTQSLIDDNFKDLLEKGILYSEKQMMQIETDWEIHTFPSFLQSCGMTKTSWEMLKTRFQTKILGADKNVEEKFVISFMGSSVTAGHDSLFSQSFPVLVNDIMTPALSSFGVKLVTENLGVGNNPCMPYDACPRTYAGADSDIIHWEQTYNCGFGNVEILEQFVRQSLSVPTHPLLVFTDSHTSNWRAKDCEAALEKNVTMTEEEKKMLTLWKSPGGFADIVTSTYAINVHNKFGFLHKVLDAYRAQGGFQLWDHTTHNKYKCRGPFVPDWGAGAAKWHPSVHGHKLRAAHHAYFWLAALRDAATEIIVHLSSSASLSADSFLRAIQENTKTFRSKHPLPATPVLTASNISNSIQCFTEIEPHVDRNMTLSNLVIAGLTANSSHNGQGGGSWRREIFENILKKDASVKYMARGYRDFKFVLYGNNESGPLSLLLVPKQRGYVFICQAAGIYNSNTNFVDLWSSHVGVYLTRLNDKNCSNNFRFSPERALPVSVKHSKSDELCIQIVQFVDKDYYVLTVIPTQRTRINVATVLVP